MINAIKNDIEKRFGGLENLKENVTIAMAYTYDLASAEDFKAQVMTHFTGMNIVLQPLSLSVACHIGPGALAIAVSKVVPELKEN